MKVWRFVLLEYGAPLVFEPIQVILRRDISSNERRRCAALHSHRYRQDNLPGQPSGQPSQDIDAYSRTVKICKLQAGQEVIPWPRRVTAYSPPPFCGYRGPIVDWCGPRGRTYGVGRILAYITGNVDQELLLAQRIPGC